MLWQAKAQQLMGRQIGEVTPCGMGSLQLGNALDKGVSGGSRTVDIEKVDVEMGSKLGGVDSRGKVDNRQMGGAEGSGHDKMSNLTHEGPITQLHVETMLLKADCSSALLVSIFC